MERIVGAGVEHCGGKVTTVSLNMLPRASTKKLSNEVLEAKISVKLICQTLLKKAPIQGQRLQPVILSKDLETSELMIRYFVLYTSSKSVLDFRKFLSVMK